MCEAMISRRPILANAVKREKMKNIDKLFPDDMKGNPEPNLVHIGIFLGIVIMLITGWTFCSIYFGYELGQHEVNQPVQEAPYK